MRAKDSLLFTFQILPQHRAEIPIRQGRVHPSARTADYFQIGFIGQDTVMERPLTTTGGLSRMDGTAFAIKYTVAVLCLHLD